MFNQKEDSILIPALWLMLPTIFLFVVSMIYAVSLEMSVGKNKDIDYSVVDDYSGREYIEATVDINPKLPIDKCDVVVNLINNEGEVVKQIPKTIYTTSKTSKYNLRLDVTDINVDDLSLSVEYTGGIEKSDKGRE